MAKDEKTRRYQVNFHPYIVEVIREAEYMYKLDLGKEYRLIIDSIDTILFYQNQSQVTIVLILN